MQRKHPHKNAAQVSMCACWEQWSSVDTIVLGNSPHTTANTDDNPPVHACRNAYAAAHACRNATPAVHACKPHSLLSMLAGTHNLLCMLEGAHSMLSMLPGLLTLLSMLAGDTHKLPAQHDQHGSAAHEPQQPTAHHHSKRPLQAALMLMIVKPQAAFVSRHAAVNSHRLQQQWPDTVRDFIQRTAIIACAARLKPPEPCNTHKLLTA